MGNDLEGNRAVEIRPPQSTGLVRVYFYLEHRGNPANHLPRLLPEKRIRFNANPARIADRVINFSKHQGRIVLSQYKKPINLNYDKTKQGEKLKTKDELANV